MSYRKIISTILIICSLCYISVVHAYDFFSNTTQDNIKQDSANSPENKDLNQTQKHLAEEHDQEEQKYEILKNPFYANERISVYNYTAYSTDDLKNKLTNGNTQVSLSDLTISFGYGISYQVNPDHKIGYEYVSSFPYNRGQLIRFFWVWLF